MSEHPDIETMGDEVTEKPSLPTEVKFHFLKSSNYRTVHVDGTFGGLTPSGHINAHLFSERLPVPRAVVHQITPEGSIGAEITDRRESKEGIIRELEVGIMMDLRTATAVRDWLTANILKLEVAMAAASSKDPAR